jgi:hypothetical protein
MQLLRPQPLADSQALRYVFFLVSAVWASMCVRVEVSNFCSYLIDSIIHQGQVADHLHPARLPELHDKHYTAMAP